MLKTDVGNLRVSIATVAIIRLEGHCIKGNRLKSPIVDKIKHVTNQSDGFRGNLPLQVQRNGLVKTGKQPILTWIAVWGSIIPTTLLVLVITVVVSQHGAEQPRPVRGQRRRGVV